MGDPKTADIPPRAPSRALLKGPLRPPRQPPAPTSYTQPPRNKTETDVDPPGAKQALERQQVSLITLSQPFVNPADAFSALHRAGPSESV
ncbi:hypothetical protein C8A05DRAFT_33395 [Staphylotrichum tortipilum]|uniref:Uncharacterized protein n=1 Tax=Staphylotrichum tortipilum TaxID=2831512 RepID=A0AAN6MMD0_9PEZI|nr:hypothetical protein C8A05DRAFT_33395 [Staphylotrichum longicolle]